MNTPHCPDKETLFGYVVGTITEDVAEVVAEHLLACHLCEQTVEALEGLSDTLVSALQQAAPRDAYAEEPACRQVLQQLQGLRVGGPDIDSPQATATPSPPSRHTTRLGDYELLKKLGEGGMGTVYQAQHVRLKRIVALKVLPKNRLGNTEAIARFEREVEAVGRLDHPNIVRAMDAREVEGIRFLVMEHVDGLDLAEVVQRCGPLSVADACEATRQAALGLQCSEEHGLVHRDIKPSNLMLSSEGHIKVLDLGLAQFQEAETLDGAVTGIGQIMGTPDYISPEQALESHTVDIRTDIYSLGCTLYYLLAGQPPFCGSQYDTPMKKLTGHIRDAVPPIEAARPDLPRSIVALLARMLAKTPSQRVARPSDVVNSLASYCKGSKLIGLLRRARAERKKAAGDQPHQETEGLQVSALVDTSRDELTPIKPQDEPAAAVAEFDRYHRWLGIAPEEQPADHYRLLGINRFESDPEVIRDAAARQMAHVRTYHLGPHSELSQKILNELGAAKVCLLDRQKKAAYDTELRKSQPSQVVETPMSLEPPPVGEEFAPLAVDPGWEVEAPLATTRLPRRFTSSGRTWTSLRQLAKQVAPWLRTPVGMTAMAASFLTVVFLGIVIRVQTQYGTVKIEIPEGVANISVKLDGDTISIDGLGDPLRLRPGAHELVVSGKDCETVCQSFTIHRGNNPAVTVTLVPAVSEAPAVPAPIVKSPIVRAPSVETPELPPTDSSKPADLRPEAAFSGKPSPGSTPKDVLQQVDLSRIIKGSWRFVDGVLEGSGGWGRIEVCPLPEEYVVEVTVQRTEGACGFALGLHMNGAQFMVVLDGCPTWYKKGKVPTSGIDMLVTGTVGGNASTRDGAVFVNGVDHIIRYQVVGQRLLVTCDGSTILDWTGDSDRLRQRPEWNVPKRRTLYFGVYSPHSFGTFRIRKCVLYPGPEFDSNEPRSTFAPRSEETLDAADSKSTIPEPLPHPPGQTTTSDPGQTTAITGSGDAGDWQSLFDGLTLSGWHATGSGIWSVRDGAIVGRKSGSKQGQGQLITDSEFGDFALRLKFKLIGGDSGVYFRGREGGKLGFFGPQVQVTLRDDVGGLYEVRQQDDLAITRMVTPANASQHFFRPNDWNDLELYAKGTNVTVRINGVPTAELDDEVVYTKGKLAIQLWGDKDTEVLVKDILIWPEAEVHDIQVQRSAEPQSADLGQSPPSIPADVSRPDGRGVTMPKPVTRVKPERPEAPKKPNWLSLDERREGWRLLFNGKTFNGWQGPTAHYSVENGMLVSNFGPEPYKDQQNGQLFTEKQYGDFVLRLEFRLEPGANSGVLVRAPLTGLAWVDGMEIQIIDDYSARYADFKSRPSYLTGAISASAAPKLGHLRAAGEWNETEITCRERRLEVVLNNTSILDVDLDEVAKKPASGKPHPGLQRSLGYIGLLGYASCGRVEYRNIRIKEIRQ